MNECINLSVPTRQGKAYIAIEPISATKYTHTQTGRQTDRQQADRQTSKKTTHWTELYASCVGMTERGGETDRRTGGGQHSSKGKHAGHTDRERERVFVCCAVIWRGGVRVRVERHSALERDRRRRTPGTHTTQRGEDKEEGPCLSDGRKRLECGHRKCRTHEHFKER